MSFIFFTTLGIIPKGHWSYPEWIDVDKATALREQMGREGVIYGDSLSYRHMCRYKARYIAIKYAVASKVTNSLIDLKAASFSDIILCSNMIITGK